MINENLVEINPAMQGETLPTDITIPATISIGWDELMLKFKDHVQTIDLRMLESDLAMSTILGELRYLPAITAMRFVLRSHLPVWFLTTLDDKKLDYHIKAVSEGEVDILIFKRLA